MKSPGRKKNDEKKPGNKTGRKYSEKPEPRSGEPRREKSTLGSKSPDRKPPGKRPSFKNSYSDEERTGARKPSRGYGADYKADEKTGSERPRRKVLSKERNSGIRKNERPVRFSDEERTGAGKGKRSFEKRYSDEERTGGERARSNNAGEARKGRFIKDQARKPGRPGNEEKKGFGRDDYYEKRSRDSKKIDEGRPGKGTAREEKTGRPYPAGSKPFENKGYSKKKVLEHKKKHGDEGFIRLNKYIANSGICSRREADTHIQAGVVTVNGKTVTELGYKVAPGDVVKYDGQTLNREKPVYLLLNKPKDYITTADDPDNRKTVMELISGACKERVYPVGRLDRNTTGLLLFTNDGDLAKKLTHPKYGVKKIYHVETDKAVKKSDLEKMLSGIELEDGEIAMDEVSYVAGSSSKKEVGVVLHSGKNRIVRRVFEHLGYKVEKLDRVYFAGLDKKKLPRGKWRILSEKEVNLLKMSVK